MSNEFYRRAWLVGSMLPPEKLLLLRLAFAADASGVVAPFDPQVAADVGLSTRVTNAFVGRLVTLGFLVPVSGSEDFFTLCLPVAQ